MSDLIAQIGQDTAGFGNVIGKEAMRQHTDNGDRFLSLYCIVLYINFLTWPK